MAAPIGYARSGNYEVNGESCDHQEREHRDEDAPDDGDDAVDGLLQIPHNLLTGELSLILCNA